MGRFNGARTSTTPRVLGAVLVSVAAALSTGCIPYALFQHDEATLSPHCVGTYRGDLEVVLNDGPVEYNGHALGFDRNAFMFDVHLPELPRGHRVFQAAEIAVEAIPTTFAVSGGTVDVDMDARRAVIDLQQDGGPFRGNGSFPLTVSNWVCPAGR